MTKRKPRMLVIGKTPALHDRSGPDQRLFRLLRVLSQDIDIDFVATTHAMRNLEEKINKTDAYYAVRDGNFRHERFEFLEGKYFDDLRAIGVHPLNEPKPRPLTLRPTNDYNLAEYLSAKAYDLVWVETFYVADRYLAEIRRFQPWAKVYVDTVDLHYLRLERQAHHLAQNVKFVVNVKQEQEEPVGLEAKVAEHYTYAAQVKADELSVYNRADLVIAASADDEEKLRERFPHEKMIRLEHPYEEVRKSPGLEKRKGIVFVGNFDHHPNVTAAIYLKHEVCPLLDPKAHGPLTLVGNNPLYLIKTMQKYGHFSGHLKVTGYVPSVKPYLDRARVAVAPVFFDSGSSAKIGEAFAAGVPLVTTPLGAELMGLTPEENCLVGSTPAEFAAQIERLTTDSALWEKLRAGGYAFVQSRTEAATAAKIRQTFCGSFDLGKIRAHQVAKPQARSSKRPIALPPARFTKVKNPEITVLLVTYNQWHVTELCLRSLAHAQRQHPEIAVEFLLVDNASADGTADLAAKTPGLRVIKNKKNLGFAAGNNVGIKAARGKDIVLLNNDTVVAPDWLVRLRHHARTIPDLGILGPSTNTEPHQSVAGAHYNSIAEFFAYNEALAEKSNGTWDIITKVCGFCFYLPRHTLDKVGLLDEGFGIGYFEDDDYCMRARDAGLKLVCAKDVYVHHFGNMSFEGNSLNRIKILEKGMSRFIFKWGRRAMAYIETNHKNTQLQFANPKEKTSF